MINNESKVIASPVMVNDVFAESPYSYHSTFFPAMTYFHVSFQVLVAMEPHLLYMAKKI